MSLWVYQEGSRTKAKGKTTPAGELWDPAGRTRPPTRGTAGYTSISSCLMPEKGRVIFKHRKGWMLCNFPPSFPMTGCSSVPPPGSPETSGFHFTALSKGYIFASVLNELGTWWTGEDSYEMNELFDSCWSISWNKTGVNLSFIKMGKLLACLTWFPSIYLVLGFRHAKQ